MPSTVGEAFGGNVGRSELELLRHTPPGTTPGPSDFRSWSSVAGVKLRFESRKIGFTSSGASICGRRDGAIRKKVIGHGVPVSRECFGMGSVLLSLRGPFPLLHQPAREHRRGIFLHPLVEKAANLFAEVGGMSKTREFKALQRIARGGEKELPRGFGFAIRHVDLLEESILKVTVQ